MVVTSGLYMMVLSALVYSNRLRVSETLRKLTYIPVLKVVLPLRLYRGRDCVPVKCYSLCHDFPTEFATIASARSSLLYDQSKVRRIWKSQDAAHHNDDLDR